MYSVASTPRLVIHISISTQVTILILVELKMVVYGYILYINAYPITYDHRTLKTRLPVRSAIYKQCTGGLVVRWVTTSESPLLYVFFGFLGPRVSEWRKSGEHVQLLCISYGGWFLQI